MVELFAKQPDIVHPIGLDFDQRGRLLVIESHTHFAPQGYKGPKHDRVRVLEDTDGDGRADRFTTFFEGTRATMDIAAHPDGSVYLATRNEILRLHDLDGDGKADNTRRIVFLETRGITRTTACRVWPLIRGATSISAWFKSPGFWVTARTESGLAWRQAKNGCWRRLIGLGQMEAEHVQPVRVRLARQQLGRAFVNAFGPFAAQKAAMVEANVFAPDIFA